MNQTQTTNKMRTVYYRAASVMVVLMMASMAQAQNGRSTDHTQRDKGSPKTASATATVMFEEEGYDFETESTATYDPAYGFPADTDFSFAYNADTEPHARLFQEYDVWIAFFEDTAFDKVACNDLKHTDFTLNLVDEPVYPGDTLVLITADNNYYKVGNVVENEDFTVTFDYQLMECAQ